MASEKIGEPEKQYVLLTEGRTNPSFFNLRDEARSNLFSYTRPRETVHPQNNEGANNIEVNQDTLGEMSCLAEELMDSVVRLDDTGTQGASQTERYFNDEFRKNQQDSIKNILASNNSSDKTAASLRIIPDVILINTVSHLLALDGGMEAAQEVLKTAATSQYLKDSPLRKLLKSCVVGLRGIADINSNTQEASTLPSLALEISKELSAYKNRPDRHDDVRLEFALHLATTNLDLYSKMLTTAQHVPDGVVSVSAQPLEEHATRIAAVVNQVIAILREKLSGGADIQKNAPVLIKTLRAASDLELTWRASSNIPKK